eukprot:ctg_347.g179
MGSRSRVVRGGEKVRCALPHESPRPRLTAVQFLHITLSSQLPPQVHAMEARARRVAVGASGSAAAAGALAAAPAGVERTVSLPGR